MSNVEIANLKAQEIQLNANAQKYGKRLQQLEGIQSTLTGKLSDYSEDLSKHCKKVNESMDSGIRSSAGGVQTENLFSGDQGISEAFMINVKDSIDAEIRETREKMNRIQSEKNALNQKIADAKDAELKEKLEKQSEKSV